jgi:hypothetical protein
MDSQHVLVGRRPSYIYGWSPFVSPLFCLVWVSSWIWSPTPALGHANDDLRDPKGGDQMTTPTIWSPKQAAKQE